MASGLRYALEVYVDDFMAIIIPMSRAQVEHVARAVMAAIHDVFPANNINADDPILEKKLKKGEGTIPQTNHCWALSSMASTKRCGWNPKSEKSLSKPSTNGFVLAHVIRVSLSRNLNLSWPKFDTHSLPCQRRLGSYREQTQCFGNVLSGYLFTEKMYYYRKSYYARHCYWKVQENQHDAKNSFVHTRTSSEYAMHRVME